MSFFDIHTHNVLLSSAQAVYNCSIDNDNLPINVASLCSVGIHPWYLSEENAETQINWLSNAVLRPEVVAVGECGLDKLRGASMDLQREVFRKCVELSEQRALPLIVHAVKCTDELIRMKKEINPRMPWILHGFRGRKELAMQYIDKGFYLSFGEKFDEESLRHTPVDRLFFETDDSKASIEMIYQKASEIYGLSVEILMLHTTTNAKKVLNLR